MSTLVTISQLMTDRIAQSEAEVSDAPAGLADYANVKERAISMAKWWVFGEDKAESEIGDYRVREYVALVALVRLIPALIDWFRNKRRLSDSKEGSSHTYYNHVAELYNVMVQVRMEYLALRPDVERYLLSEAASTTLIKTSTQETYQGMRYQGVSTDLLDYSVTIDPFRERFEER